MVPASRLRPGLGRRNVLVNFLENNSGRYACFAIVMMKLIIGARMSDDDLIFGLDYLGGSSGIC